jgi:hypothetical protein
MSNEFASERPPGPFLWRLAHIAPIGYLATAAAFVTIDLSLSRPLAFWVGVSIAALAIPMFLAHWRHENALCGICAAMTPLDGDAAARKQAIQLRLFHKARLIASIVLAVLTGIVVADWLFLPHIIGQLAFDLSFLEIAASAHVDITHRLLEPWCPYCHWDEGGDHEPAPEPTPPVGQATT